VNTTDVPQFKQLGFDNNRYVQLQQTEIRNRIEKASPARLYLEIGGKFLFDAHAARVLPGFDPSVKREIITKLNTPFDLVFCLNYKDIIGNRQLNNQKEDYIETSIKMIIGLRNAFNVTPKICVNNVKIERGENSNIFLKALEQLKTLTSDIHFRYYIDGYPNNTERILSEKGFGKDEDLQLSKALVIVTGVASDSGKLSTCLGSIYKDSVNGLKSDYSKYETFPIWNLPIKHPINLAYEAATADIGDKNVIDTYYQQAYGKEAVNYNRDMKSFVIIKKLMNMKYTSPTEMCISNAGNAIINDEVVSVAALLEIQRRKEWYKQVNKAEKAWAKTCEELENDALNYIHSHRYNPDLNLI
jgi:uncharacterized protein (UPF0371 family)